MISLLLLALLASCNSEAVQDISSEQTYEEQEAAKIPITGEVVKDIQDIPVQSYEKQNKQATNKISDKGNFIVVYSEPENPAYVAIEEVLKSSHLFELFAEGENQHFALPNDIGIILLECGSENAFYKPEAKSIVICYELFSRIANAFRDETDSYEDEELGSLTLQTTLFIFYHELGHALIDVFNLPITGREEDAADQLSSLFFIEAGEDIMALNGAYWFYLISSGKRTTKKLLADEHSLDKQRYYNILCWVYGSDPEKHSDLVGKGKEFLTQERAERCPAEYAKVESSWNVLLSPYLKNIS